MRTLVITSCTAKKMKVPGHAGIFYQGLQHLYVLEGIRNIRDALGPDSVDLGIISAKYGFLNELDYIEPYNVTFNTMSKDEIISTARNLKIHDKVESKVNQYDLVIYLLGKEYVQALELPFHREESTTHIFLLGPIHEHLITKFYGNENKNNYFFIPCGAKLSKNLGVQGIALKGYILKKLGESIKDESIGISLTSLKEDPKRFEEFFDSLVLAQVQKTSTKENLQMELF